ncbi:MAG: VCBS domain-containing protein, partial [Alphaproteobacteria bacterium]|nr:VCBS domain-containing protein [Alphaproteobacteria bacterium]
MTINTKPIKIAITGGDDLQLIEDSRRFNTAEGQIRLDNAPASMAYSLSVQAGSSTATPIAADDISITGTYGTLTVNQDGTWKYTVNNLDADTNALASGQTGIERFTFTYTSGGQTLTHTLSINIEGRTDYTPAGHFVETSTTADLTVHASGVQEIFTGSGDDIIIRTHSSSTTVWTLAGRGNDEIYGGSGRDLLIGGEGNDYLLGGDGNDTLHGGDGNDYLNGGDGNDGLYGSDGRDALYGGDGNDGLYGGDGSDALYGGDGNDYLSGGEGNDYLSGGDGNDRLFGFTGNDHLRGGDGHDTLYGQGGHDYLVGGDGNDSLFGYDGHDLLDGGEGNDYLYGEEGNDRLYGFTGNDYLYGSSGNDLLGGNRGNDYLYGGKGDDFLGGGLGDDYLDGGLGRDILVGKAGKDIFVLGLANKQTSDLDIVIDFESGDKIEVETISRAETTLEALQSAVNIRWTQNSDYSTVSGITASRYNDPNIHDTIIYHTRGTDDTSDDIVLMVLEDYTTPLTIGDFVDEKPTAFTLSSTNGVIQSGTSVRRKLADIDITDDGFGTNMLSLTAGGTYFEVIKDTNGNWALYLKAGQTLTAAASHTARIELTATGIGTTPPP